MGNNLKTISEEDYFTLYGDKRGYDARWSYHGAVIELLQQFAMKTCLELGNGGCSIVNGSESLDYRERNNPTYFWDMKNTPWPIKDKQFDMVVCLQVWEHLDGFQTEAFKELQRISSNAILSFPYKWTKRHSKSSRQHWKIDRAKISEWTLDCAPLEIKIVQHKNNFHKRRIIYVYKF